MRRLKTREGVSTLLLGAIIVPYLGLVLIGEVPLVSRPREMAGIGIVGLLVALWIWSPRLDSVHGRWVMSLGVVASGVGVAAVAGGTEGSRPLLAVFMAILVALWTTETVFRHGQAGEAPDPTDRRWL